VPSVEEIRANRPAEPGFVRAAMIFAAVLWFLVTAHVYGATGGLVGVLLFLVVFGSFGVVKGRQAGRVMTTIAVAAVYFWLAPYCLLGFEDPLPGSQIFAVLDLVAVAVSAFAMTQLYHRNTNQYIREVTLARQAG
jgi:hypothetical protein